MTLLCPNCHAEVFPQRERAREYYCEECDDVYFEAVAE